LIEFTDAIKGGQVNAQTLKGKVLVIDNRAAVAERIRAALAGRHAVTIATDPQQAVADIYWALLNSSEFMLNH
jgi:PleD family two-component response regulator